MSSSPACWRYQQCKHSSRGTCTSGSGREIPYGLPWMEGSDYSLAVGCFVVCGQLRVISSSLFQIKLDPPFSVLKSYLYEKRAGIFTSWARSQPSAAYFSVLPLSISQSPCSKMGRYEKLPIRMPELQRDPSWVCTKARLFSTWTATPVASRQT